MVWIFRCKDDIFRSCKVDEGVIKCGRINVTSASRVRPKQNICLITMFIWFFTPTMEKGL